MHIGTLPTDENNIIASTGITRNVTSMSIISQFASFCLPSLCWQIYVFTLHFLTSLFRHKSLSSVRNSVLFTTATISYSNSIFWNKSTEPTYTFTGKFYWILTIKLTMNGTSAIQRQFDELTQPTWSTLLENVPNKPRDRSIHFIVLTYWRIIAMGKRTVCSHREFSNPSLCNIVLGKTSPTSEHKFPMLQFKTPITKELWVKFNCCCE